MSFGRRGGNVRKRSVELIIELVSENKDGDLLAEYGPTIRDARESAI